MRLATVILAALLLGAFGPRAAASDTEKAGDILRLALPAAAFAVTLRQNDRDGRRQFYRSFVVNAGATWLLKEAVSDERPDGRGDDAFPSGHASMAFQSAAFLHKRYGIRKAWPAWTLAGFVAWSRVDADEHDTADVLGGAALGVATGLLLTERLHTKVALTPWVGDGTVGVRFSGRFSSLSGSRGGHPP